MSGAVAIFIASLLGSPHCVAMCGPFVAFYASGPLEPRRATAAHVAYNGARLLSYLLLGALAGALGLGVERAGAFAGLSGLAAIVAGTFMVVWGVRLILTLRGVRAAIHAPRWAHGFLARTLGRARERPPMARALVMGATSGLLPCGWLYVFVIAAGSTGSPAAGAATMLLFWLGTLPAIAALGFGLQKVTGPLRVHLPLATAAIVVLLGLLTVAGRVRPLIAGTAATAGVQHDVHR